ncbi:MAG: pseudouridine synthase [Bacteroidia bacterium]|nr:pseudouridine synthase [Bacteroidia bacterium]
MGFRQKLQFLLVQQLAISNKEASALLAAGKVWVDGHVEIKNVIFHPLSQVFVEGKLIYPSKPLQVLKFYKPRGIECTLNPEIPDNLLPFLKDSSSDLFHLGRLDKESEGLLLLTNEGKIHDKLLRNSSREVWKRYEVKIHPEPNFEQLETMRNGMILMGRKTLPCQVELTHKNLLSIQLLEGMNRQIRRMCYKLNLEILELKRVQIGEIKLGNLLPGESEHITQAELEYLKSLW